MQSHISLFQVTSHQVTTSHHAPPPPDHCHCHRHVTTPRHCRHHSPGVLLSVSHHYHHYHCHCPPPGERRGFHMSVPEKMSPSPSLIDSSAHRHASLLTITDSPTRQSKLQAALSFFSNERFYSRRLCGKGAVCGGHVGGIL